MRSRRATPPCGSPAIGVGTTTATISYGSAGFGEAHLRGHSGCPGIGPPHTFAALEQEMRRADPKAATTALAAPVTQLAASNRLPFQFSRLNENQRKQYQELERQVRRVKTGRRDMEMRSGIAQPRPGQNARPQRLRLPNSRIAATRSEQTYTTDRAPTLPDEATRPEGPRGKPEFPGTGREGARGKPELPGVRLEAPRGRPESPRGRPETPRGKPESLPRRPEQAPRRPEDQPRTEHRTERPTMRDGIESQPPRDGSRGRPEGERRRPEAGQPEAGRSRPPNGRDEPQPGADERGKHPGPKPERRHPDGG
jgi:hypothetical protein